MRKYVGAHNSHLITHIGKHADKHIVSRSIVSYVMFVCPHAHRFLIDSCGFCMSVHVCMHSCMHACMCVVLNVCEYDHTESSNKFDAPIRHERFVDGSGKKV